MGIPCVRYFNQPAWRCEDCGSHITTSSHQLSDEFVGRLGQARLVDMVTNTYTCNTHTTSMRTGDYVISELACSLCDAYLGWAYIRSRDSSQEYKVGKFILEENAIEIEDEGEALKPPVWILEDTGSVFKTAEWWCK